MPDLITESGRRILKHFSQVSVAEPDRNTPSAYLDGVLADSKSVPQLDGLVTGGRHNLAVIGRECHAQDILGVPNKLSGGGATGGGTLQQKCQKEDTASR